ELGDAASTRNSGAALTSTHDSPKQTKCGLSSNRRGPAQRLFDIPFDSLRFPESRRHWRRGVAEHGRLVAPGKRSTDAIASRAHASRRGGIGKLNQRL